MEKKQENHGNMDQYLQAYYNMQRNQMEEMSQSRFDIIKLMLQMRETANSGTLSPTHQSTGFYLQPQ